MMEKKSVLEWLELYAEAGLKSANRRLWQAEKSRGSKKWVLQLKQNPQTDGQNTTVLLIGVIPNLTQLL